MNDYNLISRELKKLGWTEENGRGDHSIFRKKQMDPIVISKSMTSASRAYNNCLSDIRRKEPLFSLGRPCRKKAKCDTQEQEQAQEKVEEQVVFPVPAAVDAEVKADKAFLRAHKWIAPGVSVTDRNNPGPVYTVLAIDSSDGVSVRSETDIITLLDNSTGQKVHVFPEDLDNAETRTCTCCGEARPANWFGDWYKNEIKKNTCKRCIENPPVKKEENMENNLQMNIAKQKADEKEIQTVVEAAAYSIAAEELMEKGKLDMLNMANLSIREKIRKANVQADKFFDHIQDKINQLDFSKVPMNIMCIEMARRGQMGVSICEDKVAFDPVEGSNFHALLERLSRPAPSIKDISSQELYQELKERGFEIIDGKFKRVVEEVLE